MPISVDPTSRTKASLFIACVVALLLVLIAGVLDLRTPFAGDQALFVTGARTMMHGSMLYRDFWDLKQPGIYWFFWLGIHFPGSAEVAVHSLELLYFLAFAGVMTVTLRSYFRQPALPAVLCCGVYFIICRSPQFTQVEGLVGFPLYLSAWLLLKRPASEPLAMESIFLVGITTAIVMLLKLVLGILPICFLLLLIASNFYHRKLVFKSFVAILVFAMGICLVGLPILAYFESNDQLILVYKTFIEDPMRITRELPHNSLFILKGGLIWFALRMGPLTLLACVGARKKARNLLGFGMVVWIVVGLGLILLQRMGWQYHFLLLLCPLAILAAGGIESLIDASKANPSSLLSKAIIAIPAVLLLPYIGMEALDLYHNRHDPRPSFYADVKNDADIVSAPTAVPGAIYAIGDPLIYYLSDRTQAVAINGWSPEWLLDDQWQELALRLRVKKPVYIFVNWRDNPSVQLRGQVFIRVLDDVYHPMRETSNGIWYEVGKTQPAGHPRQ